VSVGGSVPMVGNVSVVGGAPPSVEGSLPSPPLVVGGGAVG